MEIREKTVNLLYTSWSDDNTPIAKMDMTFHIKDEEKKDKYHIRKIQKFKLF